MSSRSPRPARSARREPERPPLLVAIGGGLVAAGAAGATMALFRSALQVRSVPERVMEAILLLVPIDLFEAGLQRFGFEAKLYALYAAVAATLAVLAALGALALRRRWPAAGLLALGLGLWLFAMTIVMPLTDAGLFATSLVDGMGAATVGYLAVALAYVATLAVARAILRPATPAAAPPVGRRSAVLLTGGAAAAFGATLLAARWDAGRSLTRVVVLDPQEPVPSGGVAPPTSHPNVVEAPPTAQPAAAPTTAPAPAPTAEPTSAPRAAERPAELPEPTVGRQIVRDKDGAVLPAGRHPGELSDAITPTEHFYVVTKNAAGDPMPRAQDWRLVVDGDVQRPIQVDYASLRKLPAVEVTKTLECISNFVDKCELAPFGCELISTARWKGVRLADVLDLAGGLKPGVQTLATISADEFTTALPIEAALDPDTLLAYEMNGRVLPREHGYPARILVPGRYGMKNAKWVIALRPMTRELVDWYGQRNWSKEGIVKTMTRIDVPARGSELPPGEYDVAGIAYAGDRGIAKVEFSADGGQTWQVAEPIEPPAGRDVWTRWIGRFTLAPGAEVTLVARATDGTGAVQPEAFSLPQPDGGAGWHTCAVKARSAEREG